MIDYEYVGQSWMLAINVLNRSVKLIIDLMTLSFQYKYFFIKFWLSFNSWNVFKYESPMDDFK